MRCACTDSSCSCCAVVHVLHTRNECRVLCFASMGINYGPSMTYSTQEEALAARSSAEAPCCTPAPNLCALPTVREKNTLKSSPTGASVSSPFQALDCLSFTTFFRPGRASSFHYFARALCKIRNSAEGQRTRMANHHTEPMRTLDCLPPDCARKTKP